MSSRSLADWWERKVYWAMMEFFVGGDFKFVGPPKPKRSPQCPICGGEIVMGDPIDYMETGGPGQATVPIHAHHHRPAGVYEG